MEAKIIPKTKKVWPRRSKLKTMFSVFFDCQCLERR
jgi:hypothetical protein